jgi:uncharacterized surface protein with fasciclin (FAS1) repeats
MNAVRSLAATLLLGALVPLAGCGDKAPESKAGAPDPAASGQTLAAAIAGESKLSTVASALDDAGLSGVFDGPGSYTLLAPDDDAFAKLGDQGKALRTPEKRPLLVALLRDHLLPGQVTPDAIRKAIAAKGGPVTMATLGDGKVTFSLDADTIVATGDDGSKARVDGGEVTATNGVAIPLDGTIRKLPAQ